jgi:hypothetical protein
MNSGAFEGWYDMRDLRAVLDHEEPPAPSGKRSSARCCRIIGAARHEAALIDRAAYCA